MPLPPLLFFSFLFTQFCFWLRTWLNPVGVLIGFSRRFSQVKHICIDSALAFNLKDVLRGWPQIYKYMEVAHEEVCIHFEMKKLFWVVYAGRLFTHVCDYNWFHFISIWMYACRLWKQWGLCKSDLCSAVSVMKEEPQRQWYFLPAFKTANCFCR